jgi:DNA-3-methyladenine glycosylase
VSERLPCSFFERPVLEVARDLLGCTFLVDGVGGRLVEVEAYRADDPASHSYRGRTSRNAVMFGPPGRLYVYFTLGLHFCVNVVCEGEGRAAAVLLRALEPTVGLDLMRKRRALADPRRLCSGPAKLTQALGITRADDGLCAGGAGGACADGTGVGPLGAGGGAGTTGTTSAGATYDRACFVARGGVECRVPATWSRGAPRTVATPRIGVGAAPDTPWRFVDADSPFLSRPLPRARRR